jgi:hypothetical protein
MKFDHKALQIGNLVAVIVMVVINIYDTVFPFNGISTEQLSNDIPNYFVPAGLIFSIWGVIYVLQFIWGFYQVSSKRRDAAYLDQVGLFSIITNAANCAWILVWQAQQVAVALVIILVMLVCLISMYVRLGIGLKTTTVSRKEWAFVHLPTSVYLGWISVATVANVTAELVKAGVSPTGTVAVTWAFLIIVVVGLLAGLILLFRRDLFFTLVVVWALLGIWMKQAAASTILVPTSQAVATTAIVVLFVVIVLWIVVLVRNNIVSKK